jgi:RNA polymerase sigma-70 factor (ECF subfamily)
LSGHVSLAYKGGKPLPKGTGVTQGEVISALVRRRMLAAWMAREIVPYEAGMRSWLARARVSAEDIDELMQEAYCQIVSLPSVDHITIPRAYFMASLRHLMLRRIRRAQVVAIDAIEQVENWRDDMALSPEEEAGRRLSCQRVMAIIAKLPERCRRVVELRKIEGWSQKEIASHLGMSEKAVEKQVWVGVRAIREAWANAEAQSAHRMDQTERGAGGAR